MKVLVTRGARRNYRQIKNHIRSEWGWASAEAFEQKTRDLLRLLSVFPEIGSIEEYEKAIRGIPLTRHTMVFYRLKDDEVIVLSFFDVRQDPARKPG